MPWTRGRIRLMQHALMRIVDAEAFAVRVPEVTCHSAVDVVSAEAFTTTIQIDVTAAHYA
jgi:hypothetical protein